MEGLLRVRRGGAIKSDVRNVCRGLLADKTNEVGTRQILLLPIQFILTLKAAVKTSACSGLR